MAFLFLYIVRYWRCGMQNAKEDEDFKILLDGKLYKKYLQSVSYFHNYSYRNIFLIFQQMPHAVSVATYSGWKEFGRSVIIGERSSIRINVPSASGRKLKTLLKEKLDPNTGTPILDANGKHIMESTVVQSSMKFEFVSVFDLSQTYGKELTRIAGNLEEDSDVYVALLDTLKFMIPKMEDCKDTNRLVREIVNARLGDASDLLKASIAYILYYRFCSNAGDYFDYVFDWDKENLDNFSFSTHLDAMRNESDSLIRTIEEKFVEVCHQRGLNLVYSQ